MKKELYTIPDGKWVKLIDRQIYYMVLPSWKHQRISRKLHQIIENYIDSKDGNYEILAGSFAVLEII